MSDDITTQKKKLGRKPPQAAENRSQFLVVTNAEVIKTIKVATEEDITFEAPERGARELLDRRKTSRARRA
jgi:hypothetical protein